MAEREPEVIGLAVLLTRTPSPFAGAAPRKVVELDNIVVHSNWRGREVGRQLLEATMRWAHRQSATHVEVAVHAFNADARRFYERFGFAPSVDRLVIAA